MPSQEEMERHNREASETIRRHPGFRTASQMLAEADEPKKAAPDTIELLTAHHKRLEDRKAAKMDADKQRVQQMLDEDEARDARAKLPATQWTPIAEAVSFISATLGEAFTTAQGDALYWSAGSDDGGYPVEVENCGERLKVTVSFMAAGPHLSVALYAIVGWATMHGHAVEHD